MRQTAVTFKTSADVTQGAARVFSTFQDAITVSPSQWATIPAGTDQTVNVTVTAPADLQAGGRWFAGMVYIAQNGRPLAMPLVVVVTTPRPTPPVQPTVLWTPRIVSATVAAGQPYETDVTFTSTVALTSPSLVVHEAQGGTVVATLAETQVAPNGVGHVHLKVTLQTIDSSNRGAMPRSGEASRGGVNATIRVSEGGQVVPVPLTVHVRVSKPTTPPVKPLVVWTPQAVSATVADGQSYETDVTFTSTVALNSPSVVVREAHGVTVVATLAETRITPTGVGHVHLKITPLARLQGGEVDAVVYVTDGGRALPSPLAVHVSVTRSSSGADAGKGKVAPPGQGTRGGGSPGREGRSKN